MIPALINNHPEDCWKTGCEWCCALKRAAKAGLAVVPPLPPPGPRRPFKLKERGDCAVCGRSIVLRKDGMLYAHGYRYEKGEMASYCPGVEPGVMPPPVKVDPTLLLADVHEFKAWLRSLAWKDSG